ncbi:hypothetical protein [Actinacidiphila oryziradicis]|uniref:Uncharacterized protein n=1 Tax=Actinacidiphila oryziradicis TaxID=2571141 RepID=A0A4U0SKF8_9ACTN|nr:hypothetical protein [Actinacidiphila oryziradicis]TKA09478.1 hypothetical protein FCI23_21725 [Actinacidiphila oryziradicis]
MIVAEREARTGREYTVTTSQILIEPMTTRRRVCVRPTTLMSGHPDASGGQPVAGRLWTVQYEAVWVN